MREREVVVLECERRVPKDVAERAAARVKSVYGPGVKVLILDGGLKLRSAPGVGRRES